MSIDVKPKILTVIIPIIRDDLINRCIETLYKHTDSIFYVFIVDQTVRGIGDGLRNKYKNLMVIRPPRSDLHYTGNLGFAKANNLAISMVETPYFMMCNDDVEFINKGWWDGVCKTFAKVEMDTPDRPAIIVTPSSVKLPDWSVGRPSGDDFYIMSYKKEYSEEDYQYLLHKDHYINEHLTIKPNTVVDGVTLYASVFDTRKFLEVGMLDEHFKFGGGEDYDYSCRAYMHGYRAVGTTMSWVYHHWSMTMSKENREEVNRLLIPGLQWNNNDEKWGKARFDIWGWKCKICNANMKMIPGLVGKAHCTTHPEEIERIPENWVTPL